MGKVVDVADLSFDDAAQTLLSNRKEDVARPCSTASVNCDTNGAVSRIFEAGGHRERRRELAVDLGLGCTGANCAPRNKICGVLGAYCVKEFTPGWEAHLRHLKEERAGHSESAVDLEGAIHVGVVDESFPAEGCARLLEVNSHDDVEVIFCRFGVRPQFLCVLECGIDIVNRAGTDGKFSRQGR
jgi:hypothetical protein